MIIDSNGKLCVAIEPAVKVIVSEEDIGDILCTAFYGGISYWCSKVQCEDKVHRNEEDMAEYLMKGGTVIFYEDEEESFDKATWKAHSVKIDDLLKGIRMYIEEYGTDCIETYYERTILDTGNIDANGADSIIQYAVFNELVYG